MNGRNILNLTALVPGVVPQGTTDGNAITGKNIFAAGNYQIGGGAAIRVRSTTTAFPPTPRWGIW